jgi:hypothetical protein
MCQRLIDSCAGVYYFNSGLWNQSGDITFRSGSIKRACPSSSLKSLGLPSAAGVTYPPSNGVSLLQWMIQRSASTT